MALDTITAQQTLYLDSFLRSLRAQNLSERTVETYRDSVSQFAAFLAEKGMPTTPAAITREHVEAFIAHLLERRRCGVMVIDRQWSSRHRIPLP